MDSPSISVIMPVYNGQRFLEKSIQSILNQSYIDFEFIIVDDCSTDRTLSIVESFNDKRIHIIQNSHNIGLTKSLNKAIDLASGVYIARMDADDISHSNRFEKQLEFLYNHPTVAILGTQANVIDENGKNVIRTPGWMKPTGNIDIRYYCMFDSPFIHSSVFIKREILVNKYKGYNSSCRTSQDYDLWSRMVYNEESYNLQDKLISFRVHRTSISQNYDKTSFNLICTIMSRSILSVTGHRVSSEFIENWVTYMLLRRPVSYDNIIQIKKGFTEISKGFVEINKSLQQTRVKDTIYEFYSRMAYVTYPHSKIYALKIYFLILFNNPRIARTLLFNFFMILISKRLNIFS
jgi:glycosyltransferase involved in cell wall biosynthesis